MTGTPFLQLVHVEEVGRSASARLRRTYFRSISLQTEDNRPRRRVLLQVDQQLVEGPRLRVTPEGADRVGSLAVGEHQDVEQLGAWRGAERVEALP